MASRYAVTPKDLLAFCIKNREGTKAFWFRKENRPWTEAEILTYIIQCYHNKTLAVVFDEVTGEITGIATGDIDLPRKVYKVNTVLTVKDKGVSLKLLLRIFKDKYPYLKLEADRHGKFKQYDTDRLLTKLSV
jgi:hypothetical protein